MTPADPAEPARRRRGGASRAHDDDASWADVVGARAWGQAPAANGGGHVAPEAETQLLPSRRARRRADGGTDVVTPAAPAAPLAEPVERTAPRRGATPPPGRGAPERPDAVPAAAAPDGAPAAPPVATDATGKPWWSTGAIRAAVTGALSLPTASTDVSWFGGRATPANAAPDLTAAPGPAPAAAPASASTRRGGRRRAAAPDDAPAAGAPAAPPPATATARAVPAAPIAPAAPAAPAAAAPRPAPVPVPLPPPPEPVRRQVVEPPLRPAPGAPGQPVQGRPHDVPASVPPPPPPPQARPAQARPPQPQARPAHPGAAPGPLTAPTWLPAPIRDAPPAAARPGPAVPGAGFPPGVVRDEGQRRVIDLRALEAAQHPAPSLSGPRTGPTALRPGPYGAAPQAAPGVPGFGAQPVPPALRGAAPAPQRAAAATPEPTGASTGAPNGEPAARPEPQVRARRATAADADVLPVAAPQSAGAGDDAGRRGGRARRPEAPPPDPTARKAGRNLPAAIGVGLGLAGAVLGSLLVRKEAFVGLVSIVAVIGVWEIATAMREKDVRVPVPPLAVGAVGMLVSAFVAGPPGLVVAFTLTAFGVLLYRVIDGFHGAVPDVTAGVFTAAYVPFLAGFAMLLLAEEDGPMRVIAFVLVVVANDVGGYTAGVLFGRHPMAPTVSPKKSWEGFAGSVVLCSAVGVAAVVLLLDGRWWAGLALGATAAASATLGDLSESLLKRDLGVKDMGNLLPGHGGIMDRLDSLLPTAPLAYLLLLYLVPPLTR